MPDDFSTLSQAATPVANAAQGAASGIQSGADWAHRQASLDLQKQSLEQQKQQHDLMKQEFDVKVGTQMHDQYKEILPIANGPYKDSLIENFRDQWTEAGHPPHESWLAALKDKNYSTNLAGLLNSMENGVRIKDPDMFNQVVANLPASMQQQLSMKTVEGGVQKAIMAAAMKARIEDTNARQDKRISAAEMNRAVGMADKGTKNDVNILSTGQRLDDMIEGAVKGHYLNTPQFWNKVQGEEQKIIRGNNTLTEGSAERSRADGIATYVANLISKAKTGPQGANLEEWENQTKAESKQMLKSYMDDVDTQHDTLRASFQDYPQATQALDRSFGALRTSMGKRLGGGWQGYKGASKTGSEAVPEIKESTEETATAKAKASIAGANKAKEKYNAAQTPSLKAAILKEAVSRYGRQAIDKVGFGK